MFKYLGKKNILKFNFNFYLLIIIMTLVLTKTTPDNLGLKLEDQTFKILINKNTILPITKDFLFKINKTTIKVFEFYQGEDYLCKNNIYLQKYKLDVNNRIKININITNDLKINININDIIKDTITFSKEKSNIITTFEDYNRIKLLFEVKENINQVIDYFTNSKLLMNKEEIDENVQKFKNLLEKVDNKSNQHLIELKLKLRNTFFFL